MDKIPQVLHRSARAVTASEFYDAIMATCTPRFPGVRGTTDQKVGMFGYPHSCGYKYALTDPNLQSWP